MAHDFTSAKRPMRRDVDSIITYKDTAYRTSFGKIFTVIFSTLLLLAIIAGAVYGVIKSVNLTKEVTSVQSDDIKVALAANNFKFGLEFENSSGTTTVNAPVVKYTYDGTVKSVKIASYSSVTLRSVIGDSEETFGIGDHRLNIEYVNNEHTLAGTYDVSVVISAEGYKTKIIPVVLVIEKATSIEGLTLKDATYDYDGTPKSLAVNDRSLIPASATLTYSYNEYVDAGTYRVFAYVRGANYNVTLTATLTINKIAIPDDMIENVLFEDKAFVYDGSVKALYLSNIPEGLSTIYENNEKTDAGEYEVKAYLDGKNYLKRYFGTATLTINKADILGVGLADTTFKYNGKPQSIKVSGTLPTGVYVSYSGNGKTDLGTYTVTATLSGDNYNTLTLPATMTIEKGVFTGIKVNNRYVYCNGEAHLPMVSGVLPKGTTVTYLYNSEAVENGAVGIGTYNFTVLFQNPNYEDYSTTASLVIALSITRLIKQSIKGIILAIAASFVIAFVLSIFGIIFASVSEKRSKKHFVAIRERLLEERGGIICESNVRVTDTTGRLTIGGHANKVGRLFLTHAAIEFYDREYTTNYKNFVIQLKDITRIEVGKGVKKNELNVYSKTRVQRFRLPWKTARAWRKELTHFKNLEQYYPSYYPRKINLDIK